MTHKHRTLGRKGKRPRAGATSGTVHAPVTPSPHRTGAAATKAGTPAVPSWYLAEARHGQQLLDGARIAQAINVFQAILPRLGDGPRYERAAILERLGLCLHLKGRPDLAAAHLRQAMRITETLALSYDVRALRATLHSGLGDVLRATGEFGDARRAYEAALAIAEELNDARAQSLDLAHLGSLALMTGTLEEALTRYRAALRLVQELDEPALEAVIRSQLGRVLHGMRRCDEAERHHREAARLREARGNLAGAAQEWSQLATLKQEAGDLGTAEAWHRKAINAARQINNPIQLGRHLSNLARLLSYQPGRLGEARRLVEEALNAGQAHDPVSADNWKHYGILAGIADAQAAILPDPEGRALLETQARTYRQIEQHAPRIVTALARLEAPGYARAVIFERLGQCFRMGGRPDLALGCLREAIAATDRLNPDEEVNGLRHMLHAGLADLLQAAGAHVDARKAYAEALRIAEGTRDLLGQGMVLTHLGGLALLTGELEEAKSRSQAALQLLEPFDEPALKAAARHQLLTVLEKMRSVNDAERQRVAAAHDEEEREPARAAPDESDPSGLGITVWDELLTQHVFEPDLLLDGPRERRTVRWTGQPDPLPHGVRPMLAPCMRTVVDEPGAIRLCLDFGEPLLSRYPGCIVMRRTRREVVVVEHPRVLWRLIRGMDGTRTVAQILEAHPPGEHDTATRILAVLAATGAVDASGRPLGRFLHALTKKGVLPGGGLEKDEVMRLAMDGSYRAWSGVPTLAVSSKVPDRLRGFHVLTRARRSQREYLGLAVNREDFDALLHTACGVTGTFSRDGQEVKLRAYPSSGALYAVEIYPVVFGVEGLEPAIYHYRAIGNVLEVVRPGIDPARIVAAMLPVERGMVAGAAAMICLTGYFSRHERKYGEGGYRMMVAEAGHVSQNLILAATALGLRARPFGGVFDALLNRELGLDEAQEQFLLAILVGRSAGHGAP